MDGWHALARLLARRLSQQDLVNLAKEVLPEILTRVPPAERVTFLQAIATASIGPLVQSLGRAERAQLMNALLPLVASEFPLADLDFLAAFPAPTAPEDEIGT